MGAVMAQALSFEPNGIPSPSTLAMYHFDQESEGKDSDELVASNDAKIRHLHQRSEHVVSRYVVTHGQINWR